MNNFKVNFNGVFFIPAGIFLIIFSILMFISFNNTKNYIEISGVVSKAKLYEEAYTDEDTYHEATYEVYVKYSVDGKEYDSYLGVLSGYQKGDKITISYDPNNPEKIAQKSGIVWPIGILILGIGFVIGGVINLIRKKA